MKDFRIAVVLACFFVFIGLLIIPPAKAKDQERTRIEKANWKYLELNKE